MCPRRISLAGGAPAATLAGMARCFAWGVLAAVLGLAVAGPAPASAQACEPLPCSEILVDLPYALDFDSDHGKIADRDGVGTGFTYVDPPTNGAGYLPANLFLTPARGSSR